MPEKDTKKTETLKLLTVREVAEYLRVAVQTVYQWKSAGKIPAIKFNGKLLFDLNRVLQYAQQEI